MVGHVLKGTGSVAATGSAAADYSSLGTGVAPPGRLWSGAIATSYSSTTIGSLRDTAASTIPGYRQFFQGISGTACDVINSSYGNDDPQVALHWFADGTFDAASIEDNAEFLRFMLPAAGDYGPRVTLRGMVHDVGATPVTSETYGLSWNLIIVPEPLAVASLLAAAGGAAIVRRRDRVTPPATRG